MVRGGANIKASPFPGGESKASEEEERDGKTIVKGELAKGLN